MNDDAISMSKAEKDYNIAQTKELADSKARLDESLSRKQESGKNYEIYPGLKALDTDFSKSSQPDSPQKSTGQNSGSSNQSEGQDPDDGYSYGMGQ